MRDDGVSPDQYADDGVYVATIRTGDQGWPGTTRQALSILTGRVQEKTTYTRRRKQNEQNTGISLGKC